MGRRKKEPRAGPAKVPPSVSKTEAGPTAGTYRSSRQKQDFTSLIGEKQIWSGLKQYKLEGSKKVRGPWRKFLLNC